MSSTQEQFHQIYVYSIPESPGWLKVGYTTKKNAEDRVREQFNTRIQLDAHPYVLHDIEEAIRENREYFTDKLVHRVLKKKGILSKGELYE